MSKLKNLVFTIIFILLLSFISPFTMDANEEVDSNVNVSEFIEQIETETQELIEATSDGRTTEEKINELHNKVEEINTNDDSFSEEEQKKLHIQ